VRAKTPLAEFPVNGARKALLLCGVDVDHRPVGNPKRKCDEHSSKYSLSKKPRFIEPVGKSQTLEGDAC
jgi:hypothetical protein